MGALSLPFYSKWLASRTKRGVKRKKKHSSANIQSSVNKCMYSRVISSLMTLGLDSPNSHPAEHTSNYAQYVSHLTPHTNIERVTGSVKQTDIAISIEKWRPCDRSVESQPAQRRTHSDILSGRTVMDPRVAEARFWQV